ncbi:MAG TPA: hypothetical protein PK470_04000, partial [Candidatus Omnitrophota bacterium]|nr:hypothetical protein [Candidatus Omnitrophota bacterium]
TLFGVLNGLDVTALTEAIESLEGLDVTDLMGSINSLTALLGATTDTSASNTVFGNLQEIIDYVDTLELLVGTVSDTSASETVFGGLAGIEGSLGDYADTESSQTVFGELSKLEELRENVNTAKSNAGAALTEAQSIRAELGASGQTPNTYSRIKELDTALSELKTSIASIAETQVSAEGVASQILSTLTNFVNEATDALGLGDSDMTVEDLTEEEAGDEEKVFAKLDEINAKLNALKEAIETDDVVVKTWFESTE